jgi:hypothetical protein
MATKSLMYLLPGSLQSLLTPVLGDHSFRKLFLFPKKILGDFYLGYLSISLSFFTPAPSPLNYNWCFQPLSSRPQAPEEEGWVLLFAFCFFFF